ncbi:uncharacterized protein LOC100574955 [Acyrthosiphon pisum]|uniref:Uncharacterized protein n=1 Tax=Acyrthosiphon pisum TaxID=7029 RepID=A0A8R2ADE4_ACYPI|nr:uncharacterized protein LOC100574955 [Acyrthosiphon pisum]
MPYHRSITSSDSEDEHFSETVDKEMSPSVSKIKPNSKRNATSGKKKSRNKKPMKIHKSYRENVAELLQAEEIDVDIKNSLTFRQGDGVVTIKCPVDDKPSHLYVISHYKMSNIENVLVKEK